MSSEENQRIGVLMEIFERSKKVLTRTVTAKAEDKAIQFKMIITYHQLVSNQNQFLSFNMFFILQAMQYF